MTELLVLAGIVSRDILQMVKKNQGVSIFLYDGNFVYSTLLAAYKNAKEKFSFSHVFRLLQNMPEWNEVVVERALRLSMDFTDFLDLLPRGMYLSIVSDGYLSPAMTVLSDTKGKSLVSGENTDGFARLLRTYPNIHGTVSFPFPVGDKMIHIDSGRTPENFPTVSGISHVILGYPILSDQGLAAIRQKLLADTPKAGKTDEERKVYAVAHQPVVITAEQVIAAGGCKKLYL